MSGLYYPQCLVTLHVVFDEGQDSNAPPTIHTVRAVRPKTCQVHMNGYREADTFALEFDAASFPFTPELIRSMGVEVRMFQTDGPTSNDLRPLPTIGEDGEEQELVIAGLVDEARYHADGSGRMFYVSGRDYTALMLDRQWDPQKSGQNGRFPVGIPFKDAVQKLVNEAANVNSVHSQVLNVKVVGTDETPSILPQNAKQSALITGGKYRVNKKGKVIAPTSGNGNGHTNHKGVPVHSGSNYWDVIYRQAIRLGFLVYVRGTDVIITTPQTMTVATTGRLRSVAYGKDLAQISLDRKLGKEKVPQVKVVCYDSGKPLEGVFPPDGDVKTVYTGIGTKKDETQIVDVHGIDNVPDLTKIARLYYYNLARGESEIHFSTKDLKDLNGNDLIYLRPGDPVQLGFDSILNEDFKEKSLEQREAELLNLGYEEKVASVIASEFDKWARFRVPFYTKDVSLSWDNEGGLALDISAINFISTGRDELNNAT